jgi:two-component sensor histidine kinase
VQTQTKLTGEKEWLLKELNHRVKNNPQIIISLLNFQTRFLKPDAKKAMLETQHRIYSMALLHQKLYQSGNNTSLEISGYIAELVGYLKSSLSISRNITIRTDIAETDLDISYAIPIGLIIAETIVNAMKHAFPDQRKGQIEITLDAAKDDIFCLTIKDNGIGLAEGLDLSESKTLGIP